jgi:hypothetical protein
MTELPVSVSVCAAAAPAIAAVMSVPGRRPEGGCACSASNDNCALPRPHRRADGKLLRPPAH